MFLSSRAEVDPDTSIVSYDSCCLYKQYVRGSWSLDLWYKPMTEPIRVEMGYILPGNSNYPNYSPMHNAMVTYPATSMSSLWLDIMDSVRPNPVTLEAHYSLFTLNSKPY